eukprot:Phypoly_transcript_02975.p1 GENE.Phypoly_transcript_02975~~Phypoly_transcript_02975.p1  ORF type:complete len:686 (+),score=105.77 Phypoly_transcript_02975:140-2197(+)
MRLVYYFLFLVCIMALFPYTKSMGIIGKIQQPIGLGEARCIAVDPDPHTPLAYLVYSNNSMWVVNTTDLTQKLLHFSDWSPYESDRVRQCAASGGLLYMVGAAEFRAVVTTQEGRTVQITHGTQGGGDLLFPIVVSPVPSSFSPHPSPSNSSSPPSNATSPSSSFPLYQFFSSPPGSTNVTLFDFNSTQVANLGIAPIGGGVVQNSVYFYGNNSIVKLTYPELSTQRLNISFDIGGVSPDGTLGYFFDLNGHYCEIMVHVVDMVSFRLVSSPILPPPSESAFCYWFLAEQKLFIDEHYIYFVIYLRQTIYKISRATLQIEDALESAQIGHDTYLYTDGLTGTSRIIGALASDSLYVYTRETCPRNSTMVAGACHACPLGSKPNQAFSATECSWCEPGTYAKAPGICEPCEVGEYGSELGATNCSKCALGYTSERGSLDSSACRLCDYGFYGVGEGKCELCRPGTFSTELGATSCTPCTNGTYSAPNGQFCIDCAEATYSGEGASACAPCPPGSHSGGTGAAQCTTCKEGYISPVGAVSCTICPVGTFRNSPSSCIFCEAGTFGPGGTDSCQACPYGEISKQGQTKCTPCPDDTFSVDGKTCVSCNKDIWNTTKLCTPVGQISVGVVAFVVIVAGSVTLFLWWRKRRRRGMYSIEDGAESSDESSDDESSDESSGEEQVVEYEVAD